MTLLGRTILCFVAFVLLTPRSVVGADPPRGAKRSAGSDRTSTVGTVPDKEDSVNSHPAARELRSGDFGELVESLQRTLNARLDPSPGLSIDGDFGAMTKSAVMRFQESKSLQATGIVDSQTFGALGPLIETGDPVPSPRSINENWPDRSDADPLEGVPFVTAKAWVIVDAADGTVLAGHNALQRRSMASTTKLMTAMVLSELAKQDPTIWDQTVTFSPRADQTRGSTSAVRAGESLSAAELLYGLMLPSGNDASVAFAEHFGDQTETLEAAFPDLAFEDAPAYERFIQAMNHVAVRLQMTETQFRNPHGLTAKGHYSCAADLAKLAIAATDRPRIREVTRTPQYGVTVTGPSGYRRNLAWYNTNRLLKIEGYEGVKTGTTTDAGACLISKGTRRDRTLIVVVLGSSSSDARYADTRNLFRWGWNLSLN